MKSSHKYFVVKRLKIVRKSVNFVYELATLYCNLPAHNIRRRLITWSVVNSIMHYYIFITR